MTQQTVSEILLTLQLFCPSVLLAAAVGPLVPCVVYFDFLMILKGNIECIYCIHSDIDEGRCSENQSIIHTKHSFKIIF